MHANKKERARLATSFLLKDVFRPTTRLSTRATFGTRSARSANLLVRSHKRILTFRTRWWIASRNLQALRLRISTALRFGNLIRPKKTCSSLTDDFGDFRNEQRLRKSKRALPSIRRLRNQNTATNGKYRCSFPLFCGLCF